MLRSHTLRTRSLPRPFHALIVVLAAELAPGMLGGG